jgi:hypothetical protein
MLKRLLPSVWFRHQPYLKFTIALLLIAPIVSAFPGTSVAESLEVAEHQPVTAAEADPVKAIKHALKVAEHQPLTAAEADPVKAIKHALEAEKMQKLVESKTTKPEPALSQATETNTQIAPVASEADAPQDESVAQQDPINSPHPIPWSWILNTQEEMNVNAGEARVRFYRTPSILSPDGMYSAYSRVQMDVSPEMHRSRVSSVMFVENLQTGELRALTAASPLADNPFLHSEEADMPGVMSILMPLGWSKQSERLLARQFEGLFNTSDATDYALIWNRHDNTTATIAPTLHKQQHDMSVLLGWSETEPEQVLFRAGILGEERWPLFAVTDSGATLAASQLDKPMLFGKTLNQIWAGPQFAFR